MSEAAAATAANTGGSIAPDAGGQDKGLESAVHPEQVQKQIKETPEQRRARFEQAIGKDGEFADFYQQGVDNAVKTRLARERAKVEKAMAAQQPVLDLLMARYGTRDLARLQESINADADWWQSYQCMNVTSFSDDHKTLKVKRYREENISWSAEGGWSLTGMEEVMPESLKVGDCVMLPKSSTRGDRWIDHTRKTYNGKLTPYATEYDSWGDYAYVLGVDSWADTTHVGVTVFAERRNAGASNVTFTDRGFKAGDAVTLSGCVTHKENDRSILVKEVTGTRLVFDSPVFQEGAEAGTVTVRRIVPTWTLSARAATACGAFPTRTRPSMPPPWATPPTSTSTTA